VGAAARWNNHRQIGTVQQVLLRVGNVIMGGPGICAGADDALEGYGTEAIVPDSARIVPFIVGAHMNARGPVAGWLGMRCVGDRLLIVNLMGFSCCGAALASHRAAPLLCMGVCHFATAILGMLGIFHQGTTVDLESAC